jgi:hypothetical protein
LKRITSALAALSLSGAAGACGIGGVEVEVDASASRWRERGDDGSLLLRESGTLRGSAAALQAGCLGLQWRLRLHGASGERAYRGRSTTGAPLATRSSIERRGLELQALWPLAGGASSSALAVGGSIGWRALDRRLHDVGIVRGYDERFQDLPLTLDVEGQLGTTLQGRMRLALPNADAAMLRLARPWLARARIGLGGTLAGARWHIGLQLHAEAMGAGPSRALYRNGVPVAAALQPRTAQQSAALFANWAWALD